MIRASHSIFLRLVARCLALPARRSPPTSMATIPALSPICPGQAYRFSYSCTSAALCVHPACPRRTFSDRVPEVVAPSARRSVRLATEQRKLGILGGGEAAPLTGQRQGMPSSPATGLRLVGSTQQPESVNPSLLGVDESAYRRRLDFKVILVDLSTTRPLEVLP